MKLKTRGRSLKICITLQILKCVFFFIPRVIYVHTIFFLSLLPRQVSEVLYEDLQCCMIIIGPVRYFADGSDLGRNLSQSLQIASPSAWVEPETSRFQLVDDDGLKDFVSKSRQRKHQKTSEILLEHIWGISRSNAV